MQRIIIFLFFLFSFSQLFSQNAPAKECPSRINFSFAAGSFASKYSLPRNVPSSSSKNVIGIDLRIASRFYLYKGIFVQSDLSFTQKGGEYISIIGFKSKTNQLEGGLYQSKQKLFYTSSKTAEPIESNTKTSNNFVLSFGVKKNIFSNFYVGTDINLFRGGGNVVPPFQETETTYFQIGIAPILGYEFKIGQFFIPIESGINFGHNFKAKRVFESGFESKIQFGDFYKSFEYSWLVNGGVGYELNNIEKTQIQLTFLYLKGLSEFYNFEKINGETSTIHNVGWGIVLGINRLNASIMMIL